jgi:hypothetical protein
VQAARPSPAAASPATRRARSETVLVAMAPWWHYSGLGAPRRLVREGHPLPREENARDVEWRRTPARSDPENARRQLAAL